MRDPGSRNAKNASEIRALAEKDSLPIYVLELDVTDNASVERAVDAAVTKAGRIDVAINSAGYGVGAGGSCHHRTSAASYGHEFFGPGSRKSRRPSAHAGPTQRRVYARSEPPAASLFLPWASIARAICTRGDGRVVPL